MIDSSNQTSESKQEPHKTLQRTVFLSRIFSFIGKSYVVPKLALTTSSWDRCIWEDCGIADYISWERNHPDNNKSSSAFLNKNIFTSTVVKKLEHALKYCFTFTQERHDDSLVVVQYINEKEDEDEEKSEHNNEKESLTKKSGSGRGGRGGGKRGGRGGRRKTASAAAASSQKIDTEEDSRFDPHPEIDDFFLTQDELESENAKRVVLTRRLRIALLKFFNIISTSGHDRNVTMSLDDIQAPRPNSLTCSSSKFFVHASGSLFILFRKRNNKSTTSTTTAAPVVVAVPRTDSITNFVHHLDSSEMGNFRLYPRPHPDPSLHFLLSNTNNSNSSSSSEMPKFSKSAQIKNLHDLVAVAPDSYPNDFGIAVLDGKTAVNLYRQYHLFGELDSRHSVTRADKINNNTPGDVHRFFQCLSWTPDGNYLIAPACGGLLVYDFKNEYRRRALPTTTTKKSSSATAPNPSLGPSQMNTFFVDFSESLPNKNYNFLTSTFNDHGLCSPFSSSVFFLEEDQSSDEKSHHQQEEECFIAIGESSADDFTSEIYFWDVSSLGQNYREAFARGLKLGDFEPDYENDGKLADFIPPRDHRIDLKGGKPVGKTNRINNFITGCFCPSSRLTSISSTQKLIDNNFKGYFRNFSKEVTVEWLHTKIQTTHSSKVFVAISKESNNNGASSSHVIHGFTIDGFCIWGPHALLSTDEKVALTISNFEKDVKKLFTADENYHKVVITRDENLSVDDDESFIIAVAGDRGTILLLQRSINIYSESNFAAYYPPPSVSSSSSSAASIYLSEYESPNRGQWQSEVQRHNSLSTQHIIHPHYYHSSVTSSSSHSSIAPAAGVQDLVFVPKHPLFKSYHKVFGSLLITCPATAQYCTEIHIWRLKPNNDPRASFFSNYSYFELVSEMNLVTDFPQHVSAADDGIQIVSLACVPCSNTPLQRKDTEENKNRKKKQNDNDDDDDDEQEEDSFVYETTLVVSTKSADSNEFKFFYYSILQSVSSVGLERVEKVETTREKENENETNDDDDLNSILRVCIVQKNDEFNEKNAKDYIETEDIKGDIKQFELK